MGQSFCFGKACCRKTCGKKHVEKYVVEIHVLEKHTLEKYVVEKCMVLKKNYIFLTNMRHGPDKLEIVLTNMTVLTNRVFTNMLWTWP